MTETIWRIKKGFPCSVHMMALSAALYVLQMLCLGKTTLSRISVQRFCNFLHTSIGDFLLTVSCLLR